MQRRVRTLPGTRKPGRDRVFLENGGSLYYEWLPTAADDGLLEAATPECRGPAQLLLYQRAQERLLGDALPDASLDAGAELGLLRHCRDDEGNVYGVQENYEVEVGRGLGLLAWRIGLVLLSPLFALFFALHVGVVLLLLAFVLLLLVAVIPVSFFREDVFGLVERITNLAMPIEVAITTPAVVTLAGLVHLCAFPRVRRGLEALLVSRVVIAGTGAVLPDGTFALSARALAVRRRMRISADPDARGLFDPTNLLKLLYQPLVLDLRAPLRLLKRRQRMQLGLSEAGRCEVGEYLALGAAMLTIDALEEGALSAAPVLRDPVAALHAFARDPGLGVEVATSHGPRTALQLQRWYLEALEAWLAEHTAPSIEAGALLETWRGVLDQLEADPGRLVGRLDWVTKRYLLETAGAGADPQSLQKIDLRYHELGEGYHAKLVAAGLAPRVVAPEEVAAAVHRPPADTPAHVRGRLVRALAGGPQPARIDWDSARIGTALKGRVVRLADYRR